MINIKLLKGRTPNIWDEEWELGTISTADGQTRDSDSRIRAKDFNPCVPNTTYYVKEPSTDHNVQMYYYDADKNYVGYSVWVGNNTVTTPVNARFFKFIMATAYGTTYNHDISINYPSTDTSYHPYKALLKNQGNLLNIDSLEMLNALLPKGLKAVDLGTLNWGFVSQELYPHIFKVTLTDSDKSANNQVLCKNYLTSNHISWSELLDGEVCQFVNNSLGIFDSNYSNTSDFKQAMNGVILIYKTAE